MSVARVYPPLTLAEEHARALARRREERVVEVLNREAEDLRWFLWARLAAEEEDSGGVDVVVLTADLGAFTLQVKHSMTGLKKHYRLAFETMDPVRLRTSVVIVRDEHPDEVVLGRALGALILAREAREERMRSKLRTDGRKH